MDALFALASQKATWLSERQSLISQNVANANTPDYKAQDMQDFASALKTAGGGLNMWTTNPAHLTTESTQTFEPEQTSDNDIWDGTHSQNTVNLEQEMVKANEIHAQFALSAGILKGFQSMILASLKG